MTCLLCSDRVSPLVPHILACSTLEYLFLEFLAVVRNIIIVGFRWVCVLTDSTAIDLICALLVCVQLYRVL